MNTQNVMVTGQDGTESSVGRSLPVASSSDARRTRKPEEVGQILGVGRNGVYELIRKGHLRCITVGRKILIPLEAIDEFLQSPAT